MLIYVILENFKVDRVSLIDSKIKNRIKIMVVIFALWLIAVLIMLLNIAVFDRDEFIAKSDGIAVRQFFIHPHRGTIYDCNQVALAWSELYYDLTVSAEAVEDKEFLNQLLESICQILPDADTAFTNNEAVDGRYHIYLDLSVEQAETLGATLLAEYTCLCIVPRVERIVYDNPAVRQIVGEVENFDNCLTGISGAELNYNRELSGVATIYEIMLGRNGQHISSSYRELQQGSVGKDITLPYSLNDIAAQGTTTDFEREEEHE